jgi:hypothetical protein
VLSYAELSAGLDVVKGSPASDGPVEMIVARPGVGERLELDSVRLDVSSGIVGDSWSIRPDPSLDAQVTLMNVRAVALIAGSRDRWALAGDQLYVDFDLGLANLPAGSRIRVGESVLEVSEVPHTGCQKFSQRFGVDALRFVNSTEGTALRLRGVNTRIVTGGVVAIGDRATKL